MRVLICGGRDFGNYAQILKVIQDIGPENIEVVIHGAADGADSIAGSVAKGLGIKVMEFPANWEKFGKSAGPIRNQDMLDEGKPDLVIAFPDRESRGTWDMVRRAKREGVEVRVIENIVFKVDENADPLELLSLEEVQKKLERSTRGRKTATKQEATILFKEGDK